MPVCSFCRRRYKEPRGLTIFTFDGRSLYYCSGKCRKNMEHLKRDNKKTNWVTKRTGFKDGVEISEMAESIAEKKAEKPVEKHEEKQPEKKAEKQPKK